MINWSGEDATIYIRVLYSVYIPIYSFISVTEIRHILLHLLQPWQARILCGVTRTVQIIFGTVGTHDTTPCKDVVTKGYIPNLIVEHSLYLWRIVASIILHQLHLQTVRGKQRRASSPGLYSCCVRQFIHTQNVQITYSNNKQ